MARDLAWTTKTPVSASGRSEWWWLRDPLWPAKDAECAAVYWRDGQTVVSRVLYLCGNEHAISEYDGWLWAGPIALPKEVK